MCSTSQPENRIRALTDATCKKCGATFQRTNRTRGRIRQVCLQCCSHRKREPRKFVCKACGEAFISRCKRGYCSRKCRDMHSIAKRAAARVRDCVWCGKSFGVSLASQETCSIHCGQQLRFSRAGKRTKGVATCKGCGQRFKQNRADQLSYCSRACAFENTSQWRHRKKSNPVADGMLYWLRHWNQCRICLAWHYTTNAQRYCSLECVKERDRRKAKERYEYDPVEPTERTCTICSGIFYSSRPKQKTCSKKCRWRLNRRMKKAASKRREAAKRANEHETIHYDEVFRRDKWRCWICGQKVNRKAVAPDPLSPSIDHVIPLARGGSHTYDNVKCAHFMCNSVKSDSMEGIQLRLFV